MTKPSDMANESTPEERDAWARAIYNTRNRVYAGMTSAFRERYFDETVDVRYTDTESPGFQVYVQKSKLFSLAALDEVLWITSFGTHVCLEPETPALEKIDAPVLDYMETAAPDERVPIRLWLRGESDEEAERLNPISYPTFASTAEEVQAYRTALQQAYQEISRDRIGIFVQNHLDGDDEILFRGQKTKNLIVTVPVSKIASLASLQIVSQIDPAFGYAEAFPDPELPEDPDERNKLEESLRELMTVARHDERIPVSLQLQTPQNPVIGECVENVLDESDQIVSRFTNFIWVLVPKYKIAALAHLGEVASIGWAIGYDARVYPADGGEVVYVPAESPQAMDADASRKVSPYLLGYMENLPEDEIIPIGIRLKAPSDAEIEATIPADSEELNSNISAARQAQKRVISALTTAFVENHLEGSDEIIYRGNYIPNIWVLVPKAKIAALAALDEVTQIDLVDGYDNVEMPLEVGGSDASVKLSAALLEFLQIAEDGEGIPIGISLKGLTQAEIDELVGMAQPDLSSTEGEIESYNALRRRVLREYYTAQTTAFVDTYLDEGDEIIFKGTSIPSIWVIVPKAKVLTLAAPDEVTSIDLVDYYNVPEEPAVPDEPCKHDYKAVVTAPTCTEGGYTTYTCSKCGDSYQSDETEALGHEYVTVVTSPTCTEAGYSIYTCSRCGDSYQGDETEALGHDYQQGVCTRCRAEDPEYVPPVVDQFRFDDVKNDSQFYYVPVYWAVEQKITKGTSEKLFSPGESCTRAQVVTFLWRAAGEPEPAKTVNPFQDVKADAYYCKAVAWAVEKGITKGTSADKFSPDATCTRAQIVTFLYRAEGTPEIAKKSKPFHDVDEGQYYADAVAWAVENGVTTGKSADTFAPNATCTRAEVVTFLYRAGKA